VEVAAAVRRLVEVVLQSSSLWLVDLMIVACLLFALTLVVLSAVDRFESSLLSAEVVMSSVESSVAVVMWSAVL
jgi:hypothetical protein